LTVAAPVRLAVYDAMGRPVRVLVNGVRPAGSHAVGWDRRDEQGRRLAAGTYFCRLVAGRDVLGTKLVLR
jgi:hypothetical protein